MSPHHHDHHAHHRGDNLKIAFFLNLGFTLIEVVGGLLTNSIAILADSIHDLGDSISLGFAWYFEVLSRRDRSARHTYGYRRFRLLGGLITGALLLVGLGFVLYHATSRIAHPQAIHAPGMIGLALLGILFNGGAVWMTRGGPSLSEKLVNWHLIEDTLGWLAVLIGAGVMMIWDVPVIDPVLSIAISLIVLWNVARNLRKVFAVFIQEAPEGFDTEAFARRIEAFGEVASVHHIHCWSIDGESHVFSAHLVIHEGVEDVAGLKNRVRDLLDSESFEHVTLEVEMIGEECPQGREAPHP